MANRKLDMGKAWVETTGLIGANRDTIGAIAGLFFFLPAFAAALLVPEMSNPPQPPGSAEADPQVAMQAMVDQMSALYLDNWLVFLIIIITGFVGSMSLLALLSDRGNPTVGEALNKGNSLRIFGFFLLLFITIVIISALVQGILTLVFAAIGGTVEHIGIGLVGALINTIMSVIFLVVIAAVHRQLAGRSTGGLADTFA